MGLRLVLDIEIVGKLKRMKKTQSSFMTFFSMLWIYYRIFKEIWCLDAQKRRDKTNDRESSLYYGSNRTTNGIPITG
jgi:low temperature requirement protein LtrA